MYVYFCKYFLESCSFWRIGTYLLSTFLLFAQYEKPVITAVNRWLSLNRDSGR